MKAVRTRAGFAPGRWCVYALGADHAVRVDCWHLLSGFNCGGSNGGGTDGDGTDGDGSIDRGSNGDYLTTRLTAGRRRSGGAGSFRVGRDFSQLSWNGSHEGGVEIQINEGKQSGDASPLKIAQKQEW